MSNESSKVIDACNLLTEVKYLVEVLFMAATDINNERQQSAIQYICDIADERIASVRHCWMGRAGSRREALFSHFLFGAAFNLPIPLVKTGSNGAGNIKVPCRTVHTLFISEGAPIAGMNR